MAGNSTLTSADMVYKYVLSFYPCEMLVEERPHVKGSKEKYIRRVISINSPSSSGKPSVRLHHPPGGGSSNIFGAYVSHILYHIAQ